ncbi:energy transducer TonB [Croceibacterium sp. LX-88]|uniref:Energy transducer TonB n=1 Tax=Croceibacterium selenioxidans TaxID=2838833 RepID=A0ABS5W5B6_9SPHN|nr:energy transducer TonB [Croceibacterium selenioxidans]MBT2134869.1 energy transducer TonB [Croceibacterium selenioxidans]
MAIVAMLHLLALAGLVRVFAPQFASTAIERASSLITVQIVAPAEPESSPEPKETADSGATGKEAPKAAAREVVVPPAPLQRPSPAPVVSGTGVAEISGAGEQGQGTGASGAGAGPGSGLSGNGTGSGARPLQLISGAIDDARDYPTPPGGRQVRRGHDVVIELTVGPGGRVTACRVTDPSPDPEADALTCRLATERFVFRPRLDANGQPTVGIYRWRQRWF